MSAATDRLRVGVDVGGTFTDVTLVGADRLYTAKVPTTDDQSEGVLAGIEKVCRDAGVETPDLDEFTHATTVATNALLEETGARTALVTTDGFRDVLEIGRQTRPDLYDLDVDRPIPLVPRRRRYEVDERATVGGTERPIDRESIRDLAAELDDVESVAVCFLHGYAHPESEAAVAAVLREELDASVSVSHEVLPEFREYERTSTTVVDAYVTPEIDAYLGRLIERAQAAGVPTPRVMQSNGGIADASTVRHRAVTTALSGPAAGVVGAGAIGHREAADDRPEGLVSFDMGGTSCDVGLVHVGEVERTTNVEVGGRPIGVPMVDVNTVGAGGGSIAWVDEGGALRVGPRSAGAEPGPACYGTGGEQPTVTDAGVLLGYIGPDSELGGELPLDPDAARNALDDLASEADLGDALAAARGTYRVANANMTRAIREMTVERGHDPRELGLVAFGGAGPMHAAAIADAMDISRVFVPYTCGVLSAYALLVAAEKHDAGATYRSSLDEAEPDPIESALDDLEAEVRGRMAADDFEIDHAVDVRYAGQSFELTVPIRRPFDPETTAGRFHERYHDAYGYRMDESAELVSLRVTAVGDRASLDPPFRGEDDDPVGYRDAYFGEAFRETPVYDRSSLSPGRSLSGPAILEQDESTVVVPPGWRGTVDSDGTLDMEAEG